ncbi:hypothetical protein DCAR_0415143 [Daucus carota subsp. sativus]|uniref:HMA domain-containing protein n=1 Tax=Daucus carota subsp. sativus TaxID=79200 RepID=A0AAF0WUM9_DAUCS|nr:hypothetical protein DCAR_0415143 [Daucus carota subsp. sativus]
MKSIDLLCASPASTAICSSTDQRTMVRDHGTRSMDRRSDHYISSSTDQRTMVRDHGTRSMARRSDHYISDHHRRKSKTNIPAIPCSSQLPINPAFYQNNRKNCLSQVVELMVSIHCKGCEGKVRKHISRIEGVTSFSIDRATKKVTVIGEVTPLGVLSSISKVKSAQFWPYPTSSS